MEEEGAGAIVQKAIREKCSDAVGWSASWEEGRASSVCFELEGSVLEMGVGQKTGGKPVRMKVERAGFPLVPKGSRCCSPDCSEERLVERRSSRCGVAVWRSLDRTSTVLAVAAAWSFEPKEAGEIDSCARAILDYTNFSLSLLEGLQT